MIDCTKGVQYLNEIKDSVVAGFQWASKEVRIELNVQCFLITFINDENFRCVNTMIIPSLRRPDIFNKQINN